MHIVSVHAIKALIAKKAVAISKPWGQLMMIYD